MSARTPWSVVANLNVGSKITILLALVRRPLRPPPVALRGQPAAGHPLRAAGTRGHGRIAGMIPSALAVAESRRGRRQSRRAGGRPDAGDPGGTRQARRAGWGAEAAGPRADATQVGGAEGLATGLPGCRGRHQPFAGSRHRQLLSGLRRQHLVPRHAGRRFAGARGGPRAAPGHQARYPSPSPNSSPPSRSLGRPSPVSTGTWRRP